LTESATRGLRATLAGRACSDAALTLLKKVRLDDVGGKNAGAQYGNCCQEKLKHRIVLKRQTIKYSMPLSFFTTSFDEKNTPPRFG
jgi:hypothetical protein